MNAGEEFAEPQRQAEQVRLDAEAKRRRRNGVLMAPVSGWRVLARLRYLMLLQPDSTA
ncbi:hypothetical protein [Mycobacterium leprae]|uniref:hypothetical protein n=1 Tax=Mycobacterium leprae TaxID=1769 RepID=UPI00030F9F94|nr:hypothetical protein [Mycobacterium leprae]